jgi:hypothetical protein
MSIWGVEGIHLWIPPTLVASFTTAQWATGSTSGAYPLILNKRKNNAATANLFPQYKVEKIGGMMSIGESGDVRDGKVGGEGEIPRRSFRGGKTITFEGLVRATTRPLLRTAEAALRAAFNDQNGEGLLISKPHPAAPDAASGTVYRYQRARAMACEIDDEIKFSPHRLDTRGHESTFVVALRNARVGGVSYRDQAAATYP